MKLHVLILVALISFTGIARSQPPALSLFDLQAQSGQLWLAIKAHLDAKDARIAALTAERDALKQTLTAGRAAVATGDSATLLRLARESDRTAKETAIAEAQAAKAAAEAKLKELQAIP